MPRRRRPPRAGALTELPPLKIVSQIAALQALFYGCALVLTVFNELVAGQTWSADLVLGWVSVRADTTRGWLLGFLWMLNGGFFMALAMVLIVTRSKLVPDFSLTTHFIHLVIVTFYTGSLPTNISWWLTMMASSALGITLGMWGCQYRELRPMSFGGKSTTTTTNGRVGGPIAATAATDNIVASTADENGIVGDEEQGFSRGRGRGRGRDGGGDYEMVKMDGTAAP